MTVKEKTKMTKEEIKSIWQKMEEEFVTKKESEVVVEPDVDIQKIIEGYDNRPSSPMASILCREFGAKSENDLAKKLYDGGIL